MPKIFQARQLEVKERLKNIPVGNTRGASAKKLSLLATKVILDEVTFDIEQNKNNKSITLEKLDRNDSLKINWHKLNQLKCLQINRLTNLSKDQIEQLWENDCIISDGVSEKTAYNFLEGKKNIDETACKYFCKGLNIPYRQVIEIDSSLNPVELAISNFDHIEEFDKFSQKLKICNKKVSFSYRHQGSYLSLNLWLRRCLNHHQNFNNHESLYINCHSPKANKCSSFEQYTIEQIIKTVRKQGIVLNDQLSISQIGKELVRKVLFKQNIIFIFHPGWPIVTVTKFWKILTKNLPELSETDHCLLLLVIDDQNYYSQIANNEDLPIVDIKQRFIRDELVLWLNDPTIKNLLNLQNQTEVFEKTNAIWQNSNNGQPEALLQAICEQFNQFNYNWEEIADQWINL